MPKVLHYFTPRRRAIALEPLVHAANRQHADKKAGNVDCKSLSVLEDYAPLDGGAVAQHP
jgi:hypothetical protein